MYLYTVCINLKLANQFSIVRLWWSSCCNENKLEIKSLIIISISFFSSSSSCISLNDKELCLIILPLSQNRAVYNHFHHHHHHRPLFFGNVQFNFPITSPFFVYLHIHSNIIINVYSGAALN